MSYSFWPHGPQHTRLPCPPLSPRVGSNACPLGHWCYLTISSCRNKIDIFHFMFISLWVVWIFCSSYWKIMNKESGWPNQFSLYQQVNFLFEKDYLDYFTRFLHESFCQEVPSFLTDLTSVVREVNASWRWSITMTQGPDCPSCLMN